MTPCTHTLHARLYREATRLRLRAVRRTARTRIDPRAALTVDAGRAAREDHRIAELLAHAARALETTLMRNHGTHS